MVEHDIYIKVKTSFILGQREYISLDIKLVLIDLNIQSAS